MVIQQRFIRTMVLPLLGHMQAPTLGHFLIERPDGHTRVSDVKTVNKIVTRFTKRLSSLEIPEALVAPRGPEVINYT